MRVLIVDDTTFIRMTVRRILEANGHVVVGEAGDGFEAIKKYKRLLPDFVVMDISMPVMDGIEAVKGIRAFDQTAQIIICSLQGQRNNVMEAIKVGANSFLIKPINEDKLLLEISKLDKDRKPVTRQNIEGVQSEEEEEEALLTPAQMIAKRLMDNLLEGKPTESYQSGVEAGYLEARREFATNMYCAGISPELISRCVEIPIEEIEKYVLIYGLKND